VILTYKTRITPTLEQVSVLWELSEQCRRLYNWALNERITRWQEEHSKPPKTRKYLTYLEQQNTLPQLKDRVPELRWVYSNNQIGFQVRQGVLILSHKHPFRTSLSFQLPYLPAGTIKQVELYYERRTNHWFVSFNCQVEVLPYYDNGLYQAFDTGIEHIVSALNSQGHFLQITNRRPEKYWRPKIAAVMAKRDRCQQFSRRWRWYHQKLSRMVRKLTNQLRDFHHWLSQKLVRHTKANTLIFGKPGVKKLAQPPPGTKSGTQKKALHYALQNTGSISRFIELVAYKAKRVGKRVIPINEAYTTQICAKCGDQQKRVLSDRTIICGNCGLRLDRDLNAAVNILAKFYLQKDQWAALLQEPSVNEESFFRQWKGFLRQTAKGKTKVSLSRAWMRFGGLVGSPVR